MASATPFVALRANLPLVAPELAETVATILVEATGEVILTRRLPPESIHRLIELLRAGEVEFLDAHPRRNPLDLLAAVAPPAPPATTPVREGRPVGPPDRGWRIITVVDAGVPRG